LNDSVGIARSRAAEDRAAKLGLTYSTATERRMTATQRAYAFTKDRILDGSFEGGDFISEGDVASLVKLSRTPIREAFLRLESEGWLRLYPKRGALIVPVSPKEIDQVIDVRLLIETFVVSRIGVASAGLCTRLEEAIAKQEASASKDAAREFAAADREFHRALVAEYGNEILLDFHDSLRDRQTRLGVATLIYHPTRLPKLVGEHRAILEALRSGDPGVQALITSHLEEAREWLAASAGSRP
jgi:DNA-binding GntR family transcriptional regulator